MKRCKETKPFLFCHYGLEKERVNKTSSSGIDYWCN